MHTDRKIDCLLATAEAAAGDITEERRAEALAGLSILLARSCSRPPRTTVVGSQPNDDPRKVKRVAPATYLPLSADWDHAQIGTLIERQVADNIALQNFWGIDVVSEGELFRNDPIAGSAYINYLAGACHGISRPVPLDSKTRVLPQHPSAVVTDNLRWRGPFLLGDFVRAQRLTSKPVKMNIPGPLSFARRIMNVHYDSWKQIGPDIAEILAAEVRTLVAAGCRWIQVDDPALTQMTPEMREFSFEWLTQVLAAAGEATTILHMCRGNPYSLGAGRGKHADKPYYADVTPFVAALPVKVVSVEDPCTDAIWGLDRFGEKTVMLGILDVTRSEPEDIETLVAICRRALGEVPLDRLMLSPKCGMLHMPAAVATAKIKRLTEAASRLETSAATAPQDTWKSISDAPAISPTLWRAVNGTLHVDPGARPKRLPRDETFATLLESPMDGKALEHAIMVEIDEPAAESWQLSFLFKPHGIEGVRVALFDLPDRPHQILVDFMLSPTMEAIWHPSRGDGARLLEYDIESMSDGWFHCFIAAEFSGRNICSTLSTRRCKAVSYPGDEECGMTVGRLTLEPLLTSN